MPQLTPAFSIDFVAKSDGALVHATADMKMTPDLVEPVLDALLEIRDAGPRLENPDYEAKRILFFESLIVSLKEAQTRARTSISKLKE